VAASLVYPEIPQVADATYWWLFFAAAVALNLSPGPDLLFILSRTMANGRRVGIASALGVCSGALVHVLAAALGVSAILATSALAFTAVKYVGALYLLYLGVQAFRSAGSGMLVDSAAAASRPTAWQAYRQGVLVDILNPKVAIFFMAFLPQFVRSDAGAVPVQLLVLGVLVVCVAVVVECSFVLMAARARSMLQASRRVGRWLDRALGSVLIGLGVRLALAERA